MGCHIVRYRLVPNYRNPHMLGGKIRDGVACTHDTKTGLQVARIIYKAVLISLVFIVLRIHQFIIQ